jgi:hypothetical protein
MNLGCLGIRGRARAKYEMAKRMYHFIEMQWEVVLEFTVCMGRYTERSRLPACITGPYPRGRSQFCIFDIGARASARARAAAIRHARPRPEVDAVSPSLPCSSANARHNDGIPSASQRDALRCTRRATTEHRRRLGDTDSLRQISVDGRRCCVSGADEHTSLWDQRGTRSQRGV